MRTTLTIDDDVAYGLRRLQESDPGTPFKRIVNDILRKGLKNGTAGERKRFKVRSMNLGIRKDLNFDNIEEVLDILEGPNRK